MPLTTVHHYLTIGDRPYCDHLGCQAGLDLALKTGVDTCGYRSGAAAKRAAKALQPFFCVPVRAVRGDCPA